jgi:hypothetical protein
VNEVSLYERTCPNVGELSCEYELLEDLTQQRHADMQSKIKWFAQ